MLERLCYKCLSPIQESMGSVLAGDFVAALAGRLPWGEVRELCGRCATEEILAEITVAETYTQTTKELTP